jgi:hypothetical protein
MKRYSFWVITLLVPILFLEGSARLALSWDWFFRRVAIDDTAIWRHRWIRQHQRRPELYYSYDIHHPVRGWAVRPNIRDDNAYEGKRLYTNSRGLRGFQEFSYHKPEGTIRIVVLGDSFTFGHEVGDEETYSYHLGQMLPGVEILNLGVHGYGHDQMLLYLKEEGVKYDPDVVLLGFISEDRLRNSLCFRDYAKPCFELMNGKLELRNVPIPTPEAMLRLEPFRPKFLDIISIARSHRRSRTGETARYQDELTLAILDEIAETARSIGAKPAFAYLPEYGEIDKPDLSMTRLEHWFFSYCRRRGIQSMYLRHFFLPKVQAGVKFKTYGHWGPLEHLTAAEGIKAYLVEKGVIDWPIHPERATGSGSNRRDEIGYTY